MERLEGGEVRFERSEASEDASSEATAVAAPEGYEHPRGVRNSALRLGKDPPPKLSSLADDELWKELQAIDRKLGRLQGKFKRELGIEDEEESLALTAIGDARECLYHATMAYARETRPRVTSYLSRAIDRARRRAA